MPFYSCLGRIAVGIALCTCICVSAEPDDADVYSELPHPDGTNARLTFEQLWTKYTTNSENQIGQNEDLVRVIVPSESNAIVYFTKDTNAAHPSYFRIRLVPQEGQLTLALESNTWGDRNAYEELRAEVEGFARAMVKEIEKRAKEKFGP